MVKLTKIYTRTGDTGDTHLAGQHRVKKTSPRIHAIGNIDELNSWFGLIATQLKDQDAFSELQTQCYAIQQQLFNLGAELAILPEDKREDSPYITQDSIDTLETQMDTMNNTLPALTSFILPGGNTLTSYLHITRSVCRRNERALFTLQETDKLDTLSIKYINRLSDWLFVSARYICHIDNVAETLWKST